MNIPLVNSSNDNVFIDTFVIGFSILLAKIFSEDLEALNQLYKKYKYSKPHQNEANKYFNRKHNIYFFRFNLKFIISFWFLFLIFGFQKAFAILIVSLFNPIIKVGFELFKQGKIYFSTVYCSFLFLIIAMLLAKNDFERIIIILSGATIYFGVKFSDFLKNTKVRIR